MTDLLPCPICSGDVSIVMDYDLPEIHCDKCNLSLHHSDAAKGIEIWNTRTELAAQEQGWVVVRINPYKNGRYLVLDEKGEMLVRSFECGWLTTDKVRYWLPNDSLPPAPDVEGE